MKSTEFENILDKVTVSLTDTAQKNNNIWRTSKDFEEAVLSELHKVCQGVKSKASASNHPHAFPDLLVNGFGVEVKHTIKDSWLTVGNSVFEGTRDQTAKQIYVVYGKMGGWPEVRWARYEDCITHVRISHAPRFVIEMENQSRFFKTIEVQYSDFAALSPAEKMQHIRQYARGRLRDGERLWWLEDMESSHSLPLAVRMYRTLEKWEKCQLRAEGALLFPEIVQPSRTKGKYDGVSLYWITRHGVLASQVRDAFTAGSVGAQDGSRGHKYIITALREIENEMREAAQNLDDSLFEIFWGRACPPQMRITAWLERADEYAVDWEPSKELFQSDE